MEREVGGGIGMGNTCKRMAVSFQCMTKSTKKKKRRRTHINVGKDVEKKKYLNTVGGNVNWCTQYGKHYEGSSKNKTTLVCMPRNGIALNQF